MIDINTITASCVANKHNMDTYLYIIIYIHMASNNMIYMI